MNKKEREKNQYILDIYKKEPVRPKELPYRRVRDDYINELVIEGKIIKRKYGKTYTLLAKPNHEDLCDQRAIKDLHMDARIDVTKQSDIKIRKEIVDRIVIPFERQMSGMIIDDNRIMMSYGTLGKLRSYHVTKLDVEKNPLYPEFVKTCKVIDPNPHLEYERFQQKSKEFFDKYKSISEEIRNIVFTEFVKKTYGKKQMNISKMMHSFTGWIEKELYKLYKKSENEQKNLEELIASGFNKIINNFHSQVKEEGNFNIYIFIYKARPRYPPVRIPCWTVSKKDWKKPEFQKKINEKIHNVIQNIAQSEKIIEQFNSIILLKRDLIQIKNYVVVGLEKYKALSLPDNHIKE